jgi:type IV secretory pathway TrbL component
MFHEPITEIKLWEGTKKEDLSDIFNMSLIFTTFLMLLIGLIYLAVSFADMWEQDLLGAMLDKYL